MEQYQSRNKGLQQTETIKSKLQELIQLLRQDSSHTDNLHQTLYGTSAEVLGGLLKAFSTLETSPMTLSEDEADYYQPEEQPDKTWPQQQAPLK